MGRSLAQSNGNDCVQTPVDVAEDIVTHFAPSGSILEPCKGDGNFLKAMPDAEWCEIKEGKDFLELTDKKYDWIITNPPYSIYRKFLNKSMEIADNIVFLQLINATFYKARLRDLKENNFGIKEIYMMDTPKTFPQFGFQVGCVHYKRGYKGPITFNLLEEDENANNKI